MNKYVLIILVVSVLSFFTSLLFAHGNSIVAFYGLRIFIIYFPLIFVVGKILTRDDVIKIGHVLLYLTIPTLIITVLQFYSPQSAWINRGVGGDLDGSGFGGALGYFRPSGLFSFTNGNVLFWGLAGAYILYFWLNSKEVKRWLLIVSTLALLIEVPISISRTMFFQLILSLFFLSIVLMRRPKYLWRFSITVIIGVVSLGLLSQTDLFNTSIEVFTTRLTSANETEGGVEGVFLDRFLGGMINAIFNSDHLPFWGYGLGLGTNVASILLTGEKTFLVAEEEWGRIIGEMGVFLGLIVILVRFFLTLKLGLSSFNKMRAGDALPWMLFSFGGLLILQGQWAQPTALGFSALVGGLMLVSLKKEE